MAAALAGCTPYIEPTLPTSSAESARGVSPPASFGEGAYHSVQPGETLWRIAQRAGISVESLARANGISDASQLEVGQKLWIPRALASPPRKRNESFVWPVEGKVISTFGMRRGGALNRGIDIQAPVGTDVLAVRAGQVAFIHEGLSGLGKTIIVDHRDGFSTVYAYIGEILVRRGETVSQRQVIARVGKTGRAPVPALHFEIRRLRKAGNPLAYLP